MLTFVQFIFKEEHDYDESHNYKGWMSPTGEPHLFPDEEEHAFNHHPAIRRSVNASLHKVLGPRGLADKDGLTDTSFSSLNKSLIAGQAHGYARFGYRDGEHYVHYNKKAQGGREAALHALHFMKPGLRSSVTVTRTPWNTTGRARDEKLFQNGGAAARYVH